MYGALGVTTVLYVLISLGVFGTLTVDGGRRLRRDRDRRGGAAGARRRRLHDHGGRRAARDLLVRERDPVRVGRSHGDARRGRAVSDRSSGAARGSAPTPGCSLPAALVLVIANLVDLSAIASVGSAISLVIFLLVGVAAYRLRAEIGALAAVVLAAIALTALVLVFFAIDTAAQLSRDVRGDHRDNRARGLPRLRLEARGAGASAYVRGVAAADADRIESAPYDGARDRRTRRSSS